MNESMRAPRHQLSSVPLLMWRVVFWAH